MAPISENHPLRRLFAGLVENAFCAGIGICDPLLTGYVSDLLVTFTHIEELRTIHNAAGKRLEQLAAMLAITLDDPPDDRLERDRVVFRRIGDYTLFWAGVYPEHLKRRHHRDSDVLLDYVVQGKRSYAIVAELTGDQDPRPARLFRHLSEDFEHCIYGLGLVRRDLDEAEPPDRLIA